MATIFDQLRILFGGFLCGAAFMMILLTLGGAFSF